MYIMKKIIKASLSLFSVAALLTACSGGNETNNPIIGKVTDGEIPSEPNLVHYSMPVKTIMGLKGEELPIEAATTVVYPDPETHSNYAFVYDHSYFTYNTPIFDRDSRDSEYIFLINLDSSESADKYIEYLKSKSEIYTVKKGDKLKNGLICTDARTGFYYNNDGNISLLSTEACFSGELTLTGTISCFQGEEPENSKGDLFFYPDKDNGKVLSRYEDCVPENVESDSKQMIYESFHLGNVSEMSEELASLVKDNECTNVQVTLKNIHLSNSSTGFGSSAVAVDMKVI